jgi:hypothetical protein
MKQDTTAYPPQLSLFTVHDHRLKALTLISDSVYTSHASAKQPKEEKATYFVNRKTTRISRI